MPRACRVVELYHLLAAVLPPDVVEWPLLPRMLGQVGDAGTPALHMCVLSPSLSPNNNLSINNPFCCPSHACAMHTGHALFWLHHGARSHGSASAGAWVP